MTVLFCFNYDAMPSLKLLNLSLSFDLEHLQCIIDDVMKLYTKFECN